MGKVKLKFDLVDGEQLLDIDDSLTVGEIIAGLVDNGLVYNPNGDYQIFACVYNENGRIVCLHDSEKLLHYSLQDNSFVWFEYDTAASDSFEFIRELWSNAYPYLEQTTTIIGIGGATISFVTWLRGKFRNKEPSNIIHILDKKSHWTALELAQTLDLTEEQAKSMLKAFGYKWDRKLLSYVQTELTKQIFRNIDRATFR